jgi:hypothetical protein
MHPRMHACMNVCVKLCMHVRMHSCMHVYVYIYIFQTSESIHAHMTCNAFTIHTRTCVTWTTAEWDSRFSILSALRIGSSSTSDKASHPHSQNSFRDDDDDDGDGCILIWIVACVPRKTCGNQNKQTFFSAQDVNVGTLLAVELFQADKHIGDISDMPGAHIGTGKRTLLCFCGPARVAPSGMLLSNCSCDPLNQADMMLWNGLRCFREQNVGSKE